MRAMAPVLLAAVPAVGALQGCAAVVVTGVATGAVVAYDRRPVAAFIDDGLIELNAKRAIVNDPQLGSKVRVDVTSINGVVLISGEAGSAELRRRAVAHVKDQDGVRHVFDELHVTEPRPISERRADSWLTGKVKARLMIDDQVDSARIKVVTAHRHVYLMGLVTPKEAALATERARRVSGVARVVKLFEFIR